MDGPDGLAMSQRDPVTDRGLLERMEPTWADPNGSVNVESLRDVQRWYALNGWTYPVSGPQVKGVAGVQQFFEGMGVSKPPPVKF